MKLEIEITEAEIKAAIERKVRVAIADETNSFRTDQYIKERVKMHWASCVDNVIKELIIDTPKLREKIQASIEAKLKAQVTALMKVKP